MKIAIIRDDKSDQARNKGKGDTSPALKKKIDSEKANCPKLPKKCLKRLK